jgi:hypothetical protein
LRLSRDLSIWSALDKRLVASGGLHHETANSKKSHLPGRKKTRRNSFGLGKNSQDPEIRRRKGGSFRKMAPKEKKISKTSQKEKKSGDQEMWIHLYTFSERTRSL